MARSAGGGGGHSSGGGRSMGGGMRSSSRSMGSSGRSHSSSFGSSGSYRRAGSGYSSSGSYHNRPNTGYRRGGSYGPGYGGYGYGRGGYYRGGGAPIRSGSGGCGCFSIIIILILFMIVSSFVKNNNSTYNNSSSSSSSKVTASSYLNHKKYKGDVDSSHGYFTDQSEGSEKFIDRSNEKYINDGFKKFYNKTGVFPHLYIIENAPNASNVNDAMQAYTDELYEQLFDAEGNLLFVYVASEDDYWVAGGYNIGDTIDENAMTIIYGKINARWDDGNLAKRFGDALEESAKYIMGKSPWFAVMIVLIIALAVVIILYIIFRWWQKKKQAEKEEAEHLEQILSQPLETFGSAGMDDLKGKYDGTNNGGDTSGQYPPTPPTPPTGY